MDLGLDVTPCVGGRCGEVHGNEGAALAGRFEELWPRGAIKYQWMYTLAANIAESNIQ